MLTFPFFQNLVCLTNNRKTSELNLPHSRSDGDTDTFTTFLNSTYTFIEVHGRKKQGKI